MLLSTHGLPFPGRCRRHPQDRLVGCQTCRSHVGLTSRYTGWVGWCPDLREDQTGDKICLMERVRVRICCHVPTHAHVAENWIELQAVRRWKTARNAQVLDRIGEVVRAALA